MKIFDLAAEGTLWRLNNWKGGEEALREHVSAVLCELKMRRSSCYYQLTITTNTGDDGDTGFIFANFFSAFYFQPA